MSDPRGPSSRIELRVLRSHHTATMRAEVDRSELSLAMGRLLQAVREVLERQGVSAASGPFARYHAFGPVIDFEAGVMVDGPITSDGEVGPGELPAGPAAIAVHAGSYDTLGLTYDAMGRWLEASADYQANGGPWEIYLTDPSAEPDPTKWLTEVIYPLKPRS
jgi:effector-binding domain-containing protein